MAIYLHNFFNLSKSQLTPILTAVKNKKKMETFFIVASRFEPSYESSTGKLTESFFEVIALDKISN